MTQVKLPDLPNPKDDPDLPSYLRETEPVELEHLPLHVALLTMELAQQHQLIRHMLQVLHRWAADYVGHLNSGDE